MRTKLLIVFLIFLSVKLDALTSPVLHCISVNTNGSITLNWTLPSVTGGFSNYHIFRSNTAGGPFNDIANISNVNITTYTDNTINANTQSYYYFLECLSTTGTYTTPSDTLQSILLSVTNMGTGIANLVWNPIHIPPLNTTASYYNIYRIKLISGIWQYIDSTLSIQYSDAINVCHDTVNYRVEIKDASGCKSVSSVKGDLFIDQTAPISVAFDSVSVDNNISNVIMGWHPSPSVDTKGYFICRGASSSSPCLALATVLGRFNTTYTDVTSTPNTTSFTYRIAAFDSCGNTSTFSNNHNNIYLQSTEDICGNKIKLSWNSYINMIPQLLGYRVLLSINGGNYNSIATLATSALSYTYTGLTDSTNYCFIIQAYDNANVNTSSSNKKCHYIILSHSPSFLYIRHATVINNIVEVKVSTDVTVNINGYKVLRAESTTAPFVQIMTLPYNALPNFTITDNNVDVMRTNYYYKVIVINSCGANGSSSNIAHTILLTTKTLDNFTNELTWNEYGNWVGNVDSYDIYRSTDGGSFFSIIGNQISTPSPFYTYPDDVSSFATSNGKFSYYVMAKEKVNTTYNFTEESNSNVSEISQSPYIYIPNAFTPKGTINNVFKPVNVFISDKNYLMQIFNRFGQVIFETDNPNVGWDGKQYNEYVQSGVYVYLIRYVKPTSQPDEKHGHVTVIY